MPVLRKTHNAMIARYEDHIESLEHFFKEEVTAHVERNVELEKEIEKYQSAMASMELNIEELEEKVEDYESGIAEKLNDTSLTIHISPDLETVTPITKVNPKVANKLIEKGYLPSNKKHDSFALNLAILVVSLEAVEYMVASFEEQLENEPEKFEEMEDSFDDQ